MNREQIVERVAALQHEQWSGWTRWMIDKYSPEMVERWERQIKTPYGELSDCEKESDRVEARKVLALLGFFDLLEAVEDLLKPGGVIPVNDMVVGGEKIKKLEAAIAKITGVGGHDA